MSNKRDKKSDRPSKPNERPNNHLVSGLEDLRVKVQDKNKGNVNTPAAENPATHKVEMQTLRLAKNLENQMLDTLRQLYGENFVLRKQSDYRDRGSNLARHYWIDRGGLRVLGGTDYSQKNRKKTFAEQNSFAISKLKGYGFHESHCIETLQATNGDLGASLELLIAHYFRLPLPPNTAKVENIPEDILEQRSDEKASLESIYEKSFEERLPERVWVAKLDLPYLLERCTVPPQLNKLNSSGNRNHNSRSGKRDKSKELCNFIAAGKPCKFGEKCRFSHQLTTSKESNDTVESEDKQFTLEIRFPPGSKYPAEPPMLCISTPYQYFPPALCLRITSRLIAEAKDCAEQGFPSVYTLIDLLQNQPSEILDHLNKIGEAFPDPEQPLMASGSVSEEETDLYTDSDEEVVDKNVPLRRQRKISANLIERQKQDERLSKSFLEKRQNDAYAKSLKERKLLPAWQKGQEILDAVRNFQVVVICGETGCGKSTQVPQFLLDDWLLNHSMEKHKTCEIICTQPRRLSAIGVAERVAEERAEKIGGSVGYQIRLESKMSPQTRLLFCTTGILLRRFENDPELRSVSHIVVDEVHERSEESDFLLFILRELLPKRPDLRVILMSATINADLFSAYFNKIPIVEIPGRTFPVQQIFLDEIIEKTNYVLEEDSIFARKIKEKKRNFQEFDASSIECELGTADVLTQNASTPKDCVRDEMLSLPQLMARYNGYSMSTVKTLYLMDPEKVNYDLIETVVTYIANGDHDYPRKGSILVFLPGIAEIRTLYNQLNDNPVLSPRHGKFVLVPLHSTLTSEEQAAVFRKPKGGARKIVLSTNIAETSITIDDCVFVVDVGRMKEKRFDSNKNMESLELAWVSRANAAQRRGRAGRVMPGVCFHLYTKYRHDNNFLAQPIPELLRIPLEQLILRMKVLRNFCDRSSHEIFGGMLEAPDVESINSALLRLQNIGALDDKEALTPLGCHLAQLPVDVRIGKLMLFGAIFRCLDSALTIAACLSYKSPFSAPFHKREDADAKKKEFAVANSDQLTALKAYTTWLKKNQISRRAGDVFAEENYLSWRTLVTIADMKHQFLELLADIGFVAIGSRRRRSGEDNVLQLSGSELNEHGDNHKLLAAVLCAALYPNIVKVLTPAKTFAPSVSGCIPRQLRADEISFKTKQDGYVHLHPSSVNHSVSNFSSPYLVYQEKVKTSRVFVRDCSMVSLLPLVMFTGKDVAVELHCGTTVLSVEEGWIIFSVETHQIAELICHMRQELDRILQDKIADPSLNLFTNSKRKKVISTIISLITEG
ncbi:Putative ATP-dependent RNA helicase DHX57 [Frankliniella fusca]|uniref:Putative ATP-dependent RNA helicase DHX57 n=1 Tax=Frankliniella fusca TaxID=407009 RepID=A0AAE1HQW9_9NEOP|nr:Putative ATP-dependent RNA helicase DHX57 [Frankliniella fusca]